MIPVTARFCLHSTASENIKIGAGCGTQLAAPVLPLRVALGFEVDVVTAFGVSPGPADEAECKSTGHDAEAMALIASGCKRCVLSSLCRGDKTHRTHHRGRSAGQRLK